MSADAIGVSHVETLIIGGGQAGLAMSHMLSQRGCPHLVLERHRIAERWQTERWKGLRFQFPNWSVRLPDFPFRHADPDGFAGAEEILGFVRAYADFIAAPVRCGVTVTCLRRSEDRRGFVAETSGGPIEAANVVVATGPYQQPVIPEFASDLDLFQVHASRYVEPEQLPPGAVLVVGAGASGSQIAEELCRNGRQVYLSVGRHRRMPRRYRGRDLIWWLSTMGLDQTPVEKRGPVQALPLITGAYGGHTIDFREFAARGITLLGRIEGVREHAIEIAPDLAANLHAGDMAYDDFLNRVDAHIEDRAVAVPVDPAARVRRPEPTLVNEPIRQLTLRDAGVAAVIWCTGYRLDFSWIDLPVLDARGMPLHRHGIAEPPGLYFLGLQWLSKMSSSFLSGVGDDAARLADHIQQRRHT